MAERAVVYLRVSTQIQEVAMQERECRAHWEQRGYDVVEVVQEKETGVDSYDWRPGLQRVRDVLYSGAANVLLVWKLDRANRDSTDNLRLLRLANDTGTRLESVHDGVITNDMAGRKKALMLGETGRSERDSIVLRTRSGLRQRVEVEGMPLVGAVPLYGYRYMYGPGKRIGTLRKTGYEIVPECAQVVRECYEKIAAGYSLHKITRELNARHVPTPSQWLQANGLLREGRQPAEHWTPQKVHQLLKNPSYKGTHLVNKHKTTKIDNHDGTKPKHLVRKRTEDDPEVTIIPIPVIVDPELWQRVQGKLTANRAESTRRNSDPESTLLRAGFAYCGHCRQKMRTAKHHSGGYRMYECSYGQMSHDGNGAICPGGSFAIRASEVDSDIWAKVSEIARDTERVRRILDSRRNEGQEALETAQRDTAALATQIAEYQTELGTLQRRLGTVPDSVLPLVTERIEQITPLLAELERRHKALSNRTATLDSWVNRLEDTIRRITSGHVSISPDTSVEYVVSGNLIAAILTRNADPLANLTYAEKREIMRLLGVKVRMYATNSEYARTHDKRWEFTFDPGDGADSSIDCATVAGRTLERTG